MKKSSFTEEQIAFALKQAENWRYLERSCCRTPGEGQCEDHCGRRDDFSHFAPRICVVVQMRRRPSVIQTRSPNVIRIASLVPPPPPALHDQ